MKNLNKKLLLIGILLITVIALPITIYLVEQQTQFKQRAAEIMPAPVCLPQHQSRCDWDVVPGATSYSYTVTPDNGAAISGTTTNTWFIFSSTPGVNYTCTVTASNGTCQSAPGQAKSICTVAVPTITLTPTLTPTGIPTASPTLTPTGIPSGTPTIILTESPTITPSEVPTETLTPTEELTATPTEVLSETPTPTEAIVIETPTPTVVIETPTLLPTGPGDNLIKLGTFGAIITIIGAILIFAL